MRTEELDSLNALHLEQAVEQLGQVEPLERRIAQAAVIEVVAVNVDGRFLCHQSGFLKSNRT
jgi:hypothetical protein